VKVRPRGVFMPPNFTSVQLATEYVVTTLNDVVDRWPEERLDVLSGTLTKTESTRVRANAKP
jgi:hypothetical protein